jgi:hypothetical protein
MEGEAGLFAWITSIGLLVLMYFLSSGAAFVATYKFPDKAPTRFFGRFYLPLDWLAKRWWIFRDFYNGFHSWCYRMFVQRASGE